MREKRAQSGLLNSRYLLKSCLYAGETGYLYHAKDTQQKSEISTGLPVLIHFFPDQVIHYNNLLKTFRRLQNTVKNLDHPILPVTDYGWNGIESYFVMVAPDSWSVKMLPELRHNTPVSNLHHTAMTISQDLQKHGHISRGLVPQAFIAIPGGLRLLSTALMPQFQLIQPEKELLPPPVGNRLNKKRTAAVLVLTTLTGALLASGYDFYLQLQQARIATAGPALADKEPERPALQLLPEPTITIKTSTLPDSPQTNYLTLADTNQHRFAPPASQSAVQDRDQKKTPLPEQLPVAKTAHVRKKASTTPTVQPVTPGKKQTPQPLVKTITPDQSEGNTASPDKTAAEEQLAITKPMLTANGLTSEQLKEKAYAALRSGDLGEKPDTGSIFYIRLLKRIDAGNPHIRRLARSVVSAYHTQAREEITRQQKQEGRRLLWVAGRVIKEFNLTEMNQAHAMLKQRQAE